MGKILSSDPDWLLEFPLFTSSARNLENAHMTFRPPRHPARYGFPKAARNLHV